MNDKDLIFLIGYMGCGKTTLGKKLAARLGYAFIDLDHELEAKAGKTIAQYFADHGEDDFRQLESLVLKETAYPETAVVSTGGGLPCFFDHMDWMKQHGRVIYIKLNAGVLASRLENNKDDRPILRHKQGAELIAFIEEKLTEREPFYTRAHVIAEGVSLTAERVEGLLNADK
ncbi:shikimate kinase [Mucilaginibacter myungsuensis]|uniref:Shikimate kinase n=1 Tax=Mucilaginibacter myungsuensis TaxID=649104 RepID=A0A929KYD8_9SPHI|nr:shikimate kinase [Mucilaginibacter myungsuensis]MBE9661169.1 shikimate kinase [Mucilaginibacter myungsuensis]MDN3597314.1 shikimate kinase [Mucilaginibacter myungsuensis]